MSWSSPPSPANSQACEHCRLYGLDFQVLIIAQVWKGTREQLNCPSGGFSGTRNLDSVLLWRTVCTTMKNSVHIPSFGFLISGHSLRHSAPYFSNMCFTQPFSCMCMNLICGCRYWAPVHCFPRYARAVRGVVGWFFSVLAQGHTSLSDNVFVRKRWLAALGTTPLCTQGLKSLGRL